MEQDSIERLVNELKTLFAEDSAGPFPYAGCRNVLRTSGSDYQSLIPDLDMYFYTIASHAGGAANIVKWSAERIRQSQDALKQSFFERNEKYRPLESQITVERAPDLCADLALHETMRAKLLRLFSLLERGETQAT